MVSPTGSFDDAICRKVHYVEDDEINIRSIHEDPGDSDSDEEYSLPCVSPPSSAEKWRPSPEDKKRKNRLLNAIKSLQCSPRVCVVDGDRSDRAGLLFEERNHPKNANHLRYGPSYDNQLLEENFSSMHYTDQHQLQSMLSQQASPDYLGNFANFESAQHEFESYHPEPSVCKTLDLDRVLANLDNRDQCDFLSDEPTSPDQIEIFTDHTNDTADGDQDDNPEGQTKEHRIQNKYSNDSSNDTPITCNRSLTLTPSVLEKNSVPMMDDDENDEEDDIHAKPPRRMLHTSLSLGDSLSPIDDEDRSPRRLNHGDMEFCEFGSTGGININVLTVESRSFDSENATKEEEDRKDYQDRIPSRVSSDRRSSSSQHHTIELLQLPVMEPKGNTNLNESMLVMANDDDDDDEDSSFAPSSMVSSFAFSSDSPKGGCGHREGYQGLLDGTRIIDRCAILQKRVAGRAPEPPRRLFWKTHPGITVKSHRFQQQPRPPVRSRAQMVHTTSNQQR